MRNLFIVCAFMFSALSFAQMSFSLSNTVDITTPMATTEANLGWFMNDDILVSFGMSDWDEFSVGARYYTGFCDNMFINFLINYIYFITYVKVMYIINLFLLRNRLFKLIIYFPHLIPPIKTTH